MNVKIVEPSTLYIGVAAAVIPIGTLNLLHTTWEHPLLAARHALSADLVF
jgi:hypothetical protein